MKKNFWIGFVILILLTGCGYKNLNLETSKTFKIEEISTTGEDRIAYKVKKFLLINSSKQAINNYGIDLKFEKYKSVKEKNISNKITKYSLKLSVNVKLDDLSNSKEINKSFSQTVDYNVEKNHSDTKRNEKVSTENLAELIESDILNFIIIYNNSK